MELLGPTFLPIHHRALVKHGRLELHNLLAGQFGSAVHLVEDLLNFGSGIGFGVELLNPVVGELTPDRGKEVVPFTKRLDQIVEFEDCDSRYLGQFFDIGCIRPASPRPSPCRAAR